MNTTILEQTKTFTPQKIVPKFSVAQLVDVVGDESGHSLNVHNRNMFQSNHKPWSRKFDLEGGSDCYSFVDCVLPATASNLANLDFDNGKLTMSITLGTDARVGDGYIYFYFKGIAETLGTWKDFKLALIGAGFDVKHLDSFRPYGQHPKANRFIGLNAKEIINLEDKQLLVTIESTEEFANNIIKHLDSRVFSNCLPVVAARKHFESGVLGESAHPLALEGIGYSAPYPVLTKLDCNTKKRNTKYAIAITDDYNFEIKVDGIDEGTEYEATYLVFPDSVSDIELGLTEDEACQIIEHFSPAVIRESVDSFVSLHEMENFLNSQIEHRTNQNVRLTVELDYINTSNNIIATVVIVRMACVLPIEVVKGIERLLHMNGPVGSLFRLFSESEL